MKVDTILCIDIGNSRIKWAVCKLSDMSFLEAGVMANNNLMLPALDKVFGVMKSQPVWIGAVASDEQKRNITCWFEKNWKQSVVFIEPDIERFHHLNGYNSKSSLGVDRWLAMVAAHFYYKSKLCVIDAGTAITMDVIDAAGEHAGGVIMPGRRLMTQSLVRGTARIEVNLAVDDSVVLADNTTKGVHSGVMACLVGGVERVLSEVKKQHGDLTILVTGGDAELIKSSLNIKVALEKHLVLQGVGIIARDAYA